MSFNQETCEVRGCRITLKRGGAGPRLLYLHGANGAASVRPFMQELAQAFEVLVPEHPGFGGSDEPDWLDNIHDLAYFYLDFLEQLDLKDVLVVGARMREVSRTATCSCGPPRRRCAISFTIRRSPTRCSPSPRRRSRWRRK